MNWLLFFFLTLGLSTCFNRTDTLPVRNKEIPSTLYCQDVNDVLQSFESHTCALYEIIGERCLGGQNSEQIELARILKWDDRGESKLYSIWNDGHCYLESVVIIDPLQFNYFNFNVELREIGYRRDVRYLTKAEFTDQLELLSNTFKSKSENLKNSIVYFFEYHNSDFSRVNRFQSLNDNQEVVLSSLFE